MESLRALRGGGEVDAELKRVRVAISPIPTHTHVSFRLEISPRNSRSIPTPLDLLSVQKTGRMRILTLKVGSVGMETAKKAHLRISQRSTRTKMFPL